MIVTQAHGPRRVQSARGCPAAGSLSATQPMRSRGGHRGGAWRAARAPGTSSWRETAASVAAGGCGYWGAAGRGGALPGPRFARRAGLPAKLAVIRHDRAVDGMPPPERYALTENHADRLAPCRTERSRGAAADRFLDCDRRGRSRRGRCRRPPIPSDKRGRARLAARRPYGAVRWAVDRLVLMSAARILERAKDGPAADHIIDADAMKTATQPGRMIGATAFVAGCRQFGHRPAMHHTGRIA